MRHTTANPDSPSACDWHVWSAPVARAPRKGAAAAVASGRAPPASEKRTSPRRVTSVCGSVDSHTATSAGGGLSPVRSSMAAQSGPPEVTSRYRRCMNVPACFTTSR